MVSHAYDPSYRKIKVGLLVFKVSYGLVRSPKNFLQIISAETYPSLPQKQLNKY